MSAPPLFVVGATGLLAAETLRLAEFHPGLGSRHVYSRAALSDLREVHPQLAGRQPVEALDDLGEQLAHALEEGPAALVLATPHGVSGSLLPALQVQLEERDVDSSELYVIDLSEDFRLQPSPSWHYGLPELHALPSAARKVAVAGCFATALQLAVVPLQRDGALDASQPLILQGVTASSGSGASAKQGTHHPYRRSDFHPYALDGHRHEKELAHERNFSSPPRIVFLPYSAPLGRGIYVTAHLTLAGGQTADDLDRVFTEALAAHPFIELHPGAAPSLRSVIGSNRAAIGWHFRDGIAQVFVALDNTIKGGAGQGLQCLNLLLGLPPTTGLPLAGHGY